MARVLAISSQVVRGHIGLGAAVPALQRLGHEVWALPTILLSNHPGHAVFAGQRMAPDLLSRMRDALDRNGWLADVDAVLTGYLPSEAHVTFAAETIDLMRSRASPRCVLVDPIIGDLPKGVYLEAAAACAIRDQLIPLADIITPNVFEMGWLSGREINSISDAVACARNLGHVDTIVTSVPGKRSQHLANVRVAVEGIAVAEVPERSSVPRGTGDLFGALLLGHILNGEARATAMARAASGVETVLAASEGHDELQLIGAACPLPADWATVEPMGLTSG